MTAAFKSKVPARPAGTRRSPVTSIPLVLVSSPLVKNCTAPMLGKPESERICCDTESPNVAPNRIRSLILMLKTSTVTVKLSLGVKANPPLRLTDVSSLSGLAPKICDARLLTG